MQQKGYDYPVRRLRGRDNSSCVTIPLQVRATLNIKRGDWLMFGETPWRGVAAFVRVSDEQYQALTAAGRKEFRKSARKVPADKGVLRVIIPPAVRKFLSAEVGDSLIFGLTPVSGVISICAVKGGGKSTGGRRAG
jgi:bifunctional DNA-binding transcriptional regulator/antitoxin component of YhaV-PrlF toxin-antitoxin module